jgi:hypothetical protein
MEHSKNITAGASTDELAPPSTLPPAGAEPPGGRQFATEAEAGAYWAGVKDALRSAADPGRPPAPAPGVEAEPPAPPGRRLRCDGWLPWKRARFLDELGAGAAVAAACASVGMSVASAYALRNRRSGRAFALMWDAILIHRARCRLAHNSLSRAMDGYCERIVRDGVVVAERHRFDNRLSMAMLTRLDRLAERPADDGEAALLQALSEDFEDYLDLVEAGGDEDAFVDARRPRPPEPEAEEKEEDKGIGSGPDNFDQLAKRAGCRDWRDVHCTDVPVDGLDPDRKSEWSSEDWVRAGRSLFLLWLDRMNEAGHELPPGPECAAHFDRVRRFAADRILGTPAEGSWQASTSSTSRPNRHERRRRRKLQKPRKRARRA